MAFTRNEGAVDRTVRLSAGIAALIIGWQFWPGALAVALLAVGAIATITGIVGWCPAYTLFGASTCARKL